MEIRTSPLTYAAGAALVDSDLRIVELSAALAQLAGAPPGPHRGRTLAEALPALAPALEPLARRALAHGEAAVDVEAPLQAGGRLLLSCYPVRSRSGIVLGADLVVRGAALPDDPHAAPPSQAPAAPEAPADCQTRALHLVADAVAAVDADERVTLWNRAAERLYGVPAAEAIGRPLASIYTTLWLDPADEQAARDALAAGGTWSGEILHRTPDGRTLQVEAVLSALPDGAGAYAGWLAVTRDTSGRRRAERNARLLAELAESLMQQVDTAEIIALVTRALGEHLGADRCLMDELDEDGGVVVHRGFDRDGVSSAGRYPLGYPEALLRELGDGHTLVFADAAADERLAGRYELLCVPLGGRAGVAVPRMRHGRWAATLLLIAGAPREWHAEDVALLRAAADLAWLAVERGRLYQALETAVRERDTLFSIAAHDLRTPITVLLGQGQLLARRAEQDGISERNQRTIRTLVEQSARLNQMISGLLDFARIQEGRLSIRPLPIELGPLLERIVLTLQPTLDQHSVTLMGADQAALVAGDSMRLEQVFQNLIGNAIKYSPAGGLVLVTLEREGDNALVRIADRGIGIPRASLGRVFERFFRAPNAQQLSSTGLGVGLYVVKEIVALHRGSVSLESVEGEGTTVTVRLPLVVPGESCA